MHNKHLTQIDIKPYFSTTDEAQRYPLMCWCLQNCIHPLPEEAMLHKDDERYWMNLIDYLGARQEYEKYMLTKNKQI